MAAPSDAGTRPALVFCDGKERGWGPIEHLVYLASDLLGADLRLTPLPPPSRAAALRRALLPVPRGPAPGGLYVVKSPGAIKALMSLEDFGRPQAFRVLWMVDSFWTERVPMARLMRHFDLLVYMQKGDAEFYETLAPGRTLHLGWGADALDLGAAAAVRGVDVLRVGRQPPAWEDDARSAEACAAAGLRFAGRPPFPPADPADPSADQRALCAHYADAKFVIAHSNLAAPAPYTHPRKEYVTGRWTDALAAGAIVAGVPPLSDVTAEELLWPEALLPFDRIDLAENVETLRAAVAGWSPDRARYNHLQALKRLDWRWRLQALADRLGLAAPRLDADLDRLRGRIAALEDGDRDAPAG